MSQRFIKQLTALDIALVAYCHAAKSALARHSKWAVKGGFGLLLGACISCSGGGGIGSVQGTVSVDGAPVDIGTIYLKPTADSGAKGVGGAITEGVFELSAVEAMPPGKYQAVVQASRKTGRIVKDQQKGDVPELTPLALQNSPLEIDLSHANAGGLKLEFVTTK